MPEPKPNTKIYEDLAKKGNYDAIVDLATDAFMKIVSNKPGAIKEKKEFDAFYTDLFAHKPGEQPSQEKKAVLNNILDSFYEKVADTIVEEEKEIRKNEEKIKTGEIQEFSLLKNDPKKVRKLAEAITFSQHPSGLRAQAFFQMVTDLAVTIPDDVGVDDLYSDIGGKTKAKIKEKLKDSYDISDETLDKKTIADDLLKAEFSTVEQYTFSEYPVEAGKNFLIGTNDEHDNIKNLKTHELAKELAKKEKEFEQFKEKNKQLLEIVGDSKKLGEAIGKVGGLNGENAVVKALFDEITNVTEFGTSEFTVETITDFSTGRTDRIHTNAVNPNTYSNAIKMLEKASTNLTNEYFEQDNPEAKAAQEVNKIINEFVTEHKAILGNVKKTYGKGMGNPEKQIDLIRCEQENRVLSNDVTKNLGDACRLRDQKINQISLYTDAAQRGLDIISKAAGWLTEDRKTHTRCSPSYTNFSQAMEDLGKMNANNTSPEALLAKMQQARQAAVEYHESHTGWKHIATGYTDNGKDRITYSKLAMDVLEKKIAELTDVVQKITPLLDGKTPGDAKSSLEAENTAARTELNQELAALKIKNDQNEANKRIANNFINTEINKAQDQLNNAKAQAGEGNYPDKENVKLNYAKIITATTLKLAAKNSKYVPKTSTFEAQCNNTLKSASFVRMIDGMTSEQLYKNAVEKDGQQLYMKFANAYEANKQNAEPKKNNNNNEMVKRSEAPVK